MLDKNTFSIVLDNAPLVSIDLCLVWDSKLLLAKRNNDPLKGHWFTPGGRLNKNEPWQRGLERIAKLELGLDVNSSKFNLMGVFDHFYSNSFLDENISTHYVNLPHYMIYDCCPTIQLDEQHDESNWFDIKELSYNKGTHKYMRKYANWLLNLEKDLKLG